MKRIIIILAILTITAPAWAGNPMLRPLTEQEQYVYLSTGHFLAAGEALTMSNNFFLAYLTWKDVSYLDAAVEMIGVAGDAAEKQLYYDSMINVTVPDYSQALGKSSQESLWDKIEAARRLLLEKIMAERAITP